MPDLSFGSRFNKIFIFICDPSRLFGAALPRSFANTPGAAFESRYSPKTVSPFSNVTDTPVDEDSTLIALEFSEISTPFGSYTN
jgi:hypothetical protein